MSTPLLLPGSGGIEDGRRKISDVGIGETSVEIEEHNGGSSGSATLRGRSLVATSVRTTRRVRRRGPCGSAHLQQQAHPTERSEAAAGGGQNWIPAVAAASAANSEAVGGKTKFYSARRPRPRGAALPAGTNKKEELRKLGKKRRCSGEVEFFNDEPIVIGGGQDGAAPEHLPPSHQPCSLQELTNTSDMMEGGRLGQLQLLQLPRRQTTCSGKSPHDPGDGFRSSPEAWMAYLNELEEFEYMHCCGDNELLAGILKLCNKVNPKFGGEGREDDPRWDDVRRFLRESSAEEVEAAAKGEDKNGNIPLHLVCSSKPPKDVVDALLDAWLESVYEQNFREHLPIHSACQHGASADIVRLLIDRGGDYTCIAADDTCQIPLHLACRGGTSVDVVNLLIDRGGDDSCKAETETGFVPLHIACQYGASIDIIRILIHKGGEDTCKAKTRDGYTPLHVACHKGASIEVVQLLVAMGGTDTCKAADEEGWTPLHHACFFGISTDVIRLLINKGGRKNCQIACKRGRCPLYYGFRGQNKKSENKLQEDAVRSIIEAGGFEPLKDLLDVEHDDQVLCMSFSETKVALNHGFTKRPVLASVMLDLYAQIILVTLLSATVSKNIGINGRTNEWQVLLLILILTWLTIREVMQMATFSYQRYVLDIWNWLDITQIALVITSTSLLNSGETIDDNYWNRVVLTVTVGLAWFALLGVLKNFLYGIAIFVVSLQKILVELVPFLVVTAVTIAAFVFMFRSLNNNAEHCSSGSNDLAAENEWYCGTTIQLFAELSSFMLGKLEIDTEIAEESGTTAGILYVFGFFMAMILLNVLIAKMSNVFSQVEDAGSKVFWRNRYSVVVETMLVLDLIRRCFSWVTKREPKLIATDETDDDKPGRDVVRELLFKPRHPWDKTLSDGPCKFVCQELWRVCCRMLCPIALLLNFFLGLVSCGMLWQKWMTQWLFSGDVSEDGRSQLEQELKERDEAVDMKIAGVDDKIAALDAKIENKISELDSKIAGMGNRMDRMEGKIDEILKAVLTGRKSSLL